jgi:hypothetical protein
MNYDHFERQVLGYDQHMGCRLARSRMLRSGSARKTASAARGAGPVRFHLAVALRSLADHLDTHSATLA